MTDPMSHKAVELEQVRADAKAAVVIVVERAAERLEANRAHLNFAALLGLLRDEALPEPVVTTLSDWLDGIAAAIRALAPEDAIAEVAKLRAKAWAAKQAIQEMHDLASANAAHADRLAAELAAANAREAGLRDFIGDFANAKIDALRYQPAYGESPEDEPDPVVDAETVWAWQADAKSLP